MKRNNVFTSLLTNALPSENSSSSTGVPQISPTALLETFIPFYGPIHRFILYSLNLDITVIVSLFTVLWLSARIFRSVWAATWGFLSSYFMAEISISSTDEIHSHLISFLAHQYKVKSARRLMAETPTKSAWELDSEVTESPESTVDGEGNIKWLNFSNQEAKSQPRFTPAIGSHNFWHQGTFFQLRRKEVAMFDELGSGGAAFTDKEVLTLSCFGRSTEPIKALIQHAKAHFHLGHNAKTIIKRPATKDMRRFGGRGSWVKIAERPCRPMKTVVLDEARKMDVMGDINEYLNPATARWYANRGIPYRRGYLFYGPPGTGKTSLTFALAGVFGLDIHVVSLLEPTLTEEELGCLFTNLPARCIVLLEDIDTAGLVRNNEVEVEPENGGEKGREGRGRHQNEESLNVASLTKALKKANEQSEEEKKKGISLSGLLNIIDGVASHEGRVLVMTTNRPEALDEALIRPGRVDHQVAFGNATQLQIKQLFERMYSNDHPRSKFVKSQPATTNGHLTPPEKSDALTPPITPVTECTTTVNGRPQINENKEVTEEELKIIAKEFSEKVPDDMFSPAEIQGFLLKRKTEPRKAVREIGEWVEGMVEVKRKGSKLIRMQ